MPILLLLLGLLLPGSQSQQASTPLQAAVVPTALVKVPADAAKLVNPVTPTAESQAHVKKVYGWDCAVCHGDNGDGKGDLGVKYKLRNWTGAASLNDLSDGELFYIIKNGRGQMPPEGDRTKDEDIWNMMVLVRAYAKR